MNRLRVRIGVFVLLSLVLALRAGFAEEASGSPEAPPAEATPADAASPGDGAMEPTSEGASEATTAPAEGTTDGTASEGATGTTTGAMDGVAPDETTSGGASETTTDTPSEGMTPDGASETSTPATTSPDVLPVTPGEFSAPASGATTVPGQRGDSAVYRIRFAPTADQVRRLIESNSEQMKLVLPSQVPDAAPEERSRLTTTTITSQVTFGAQPEGGWTQTEVVQSYKRFEEGIAMPDPLEAALKGSQLVTKLDANGAYVGVVEPGQFLAGLLSRTPEPMRPSLQAALSPEAIDHESRQGWQRKVGRYLTVPLRIGHPSFLVEYEVLGEVGRFPYILCAIPSAVEQVKGKTCIRVDLVSFAATLKDGVMSGVPDEVDADFMAWAEGKDIPFSPPELSVWGAGELLLELNGAGTVRYRNEESFHLSPARINRPMGGPIDADELNVKRISELSVE